MHDRGDLMATECCDVVTIGARLAGSCAATHVARVGRSVVVLDRSSFPPNEFSTHLLFPSGALARQQSGNVHAVSVTAVAAA
jgi:menaquinone-9 beta-reductase